MGPFEGKSATMIGGAAAVFSCLGLVFRGPILSQIEYATDRCWSLCPLSRHLLGVQRRTRWSPLQVFTSRPRFIW